MARLSKLQVTCFSKIPLKLRKQNKAFCSSFILYKKEFSINDLGKIPKEFKSDQLFMKLIFNKLAYQKIHRDFDRILRLEKFYKTTQDNLFGKMNLIYAHTLLLEQGKRIFILI